MLSLAVLTIFAFVTEAHAQPKVSPFRQTRIPLKRFLPTLNLPAPMPQGTRTWDHRASAYAGAGAQLARAAFAAAGAEAPLVRAEVAATGKTNVFGEKLEGCGEKNEGEMCSYTEESPQICVRTGKFTMRYGCKSIWEANWKQFQTVGGKVIEKQKPAVGDTTQCQGVPAEVLDSQYSKDVYANFWSTAEIPKYDEFNGVWDFKNTKIPKKSFKARKFRKAIDFICQTCALYATSKDAEKALFAKCKEVGWAPGALAELPALKESAEGGAKETGKEITKDDAETKEGDADDAAKETAAETPSEMFAQTSPGIINIPALGLIGFFVGSAVTFMVLSFRHSTVRTIKM